MKALLVVLVSALGCTVALADGPIVPFLQPGTDYMIRFAAGSDVFEFKQDGLSESSYTTAEGEKKSGGPVKWSLKATVDVFRLVRFGNGSWVAMEHPAASSGILKWNAKRKAMAQLTAENIAQLESSDEGKLVLERLRKAAAQEVKTTVSWINLDHAVAISDVPSALDESTAKAKPQADVSTLDSSKSQLPSDVFVSGSQNGRLMFGKHAPVEVTIGYSLPKIVPLTPEAAPESQASALQSPDVGPGCGKIIPEPPLKLEGEPVDDLFKP